MLIVLHCYTWSTGCFFESMMVGFCQSKSLPWPENWIATYCDWKGNFMITRRSTEKSGIVWNCHIPKPEKVHATKSNGPSDAFRIVTSSAWKLLEDHCWGHLLSRHLHQSIQRGDSWGDKRGKNGASESFNQLPRKWKAAGKRHLFAPCQEERHFLLFSGNLRRKSTVFLGVWCWFRSSTWSFCWFFPLW